MKFNACFEKPDAFSFASRRSGFIVSKAFERSINMAEIFFYLSKAFFHFSSMTIIEFCVPCDFLKPEKHFETCFL